MDFNYLKQRSRQLIGETRPSPILVGVIYLLLNIVVNYLNSAIFSPGQDELLRLSELLQSGDMDTVLLYLSRIMPTGMEWGILIALRLVLSAVSVGFVVYLLNAIRRNEPCIANLLDGFPVFFKVLWLNIVQGFFTFLWFLAVMVPGIALLVFLSSIKEFFAYLAPLLYIPVVIIAYRYSQTLYILLDDPSKGAIRCIRESVKMMKGHKWEMFVLSLSFLGWVLLSLIPFVSVWTTPYMGMTYALYYETLRTGSIPSSAKGQMYLSDNSCDCSRPEEYRPEDKDSLPPRDDEDDRYR